MSQLTHRSARVLELLNPQDGRLTVPEVELSQNVSSDSLDQEEYFGGGPVERSTQSFDDLQLEASRHITRNCLIAADIDLTLLNQGSDKERQEFLVDVAPQLIRAASLGTNLAFITGNDMHELCNRFLKWLIEHLSLTDQLELLHNIHMFFNSGGVYVNFSSLDLKKISSGKPFNPKPIEKLRDRLFRIITMPEREGGNLIIRPQFIDADYIERSEIPEDDARKIRIILEEAARTYLRELEARRLTLNRTYDIARVSDHSGIIRPRAHVRTVSYYSKGTVKQAVVQITLKPILSSRHARRDSQPTGKDPRSKVVEMIQSKLDEQGLGYEARPGGRSSIDVTLERLDKAYALEFLIDRLKLQGLSRQGRKFGSNTIYFGDEVIMGGGNDYPVTRIPGLLVFAVNSDRERVPCLSDVFVPSTILEGPEATAEVLMHYNKCACRLLKDYLRRDKKRSVNRTAVEVLKEEIFAKRVREKIASLSDANQTPVEVWQTLHTFVTLMCRNDPNARQWLSILIGELDAIMKQLATSRPSVHPALGSSHPDDGGDRAHTS
jgi:hydroxymethylpyrimidine pyrophosphatase-like HAD family hydrolase